MEQTSTLHVCRYHYDLNLLDNDKWEDTMKSITQVYLQQIRFKKYN